MGEIVLKKTSKATRRRAAVSVPAETYMKVYTLAHEVGMPIERLVETLLEEALKQVRVEE